MGQAPFRKAENEPVPNSDDYHLSADGKQIVRERSKGLLQVIEDQPQSFG